MARHYLPGAFGRRTRGHPRSARSSAGRGLHLLRITAALSVVVSMAVAIGPPVAAEDVFGIQVGQGAVSPPSPQSLKSESVLEGFVGRECSVTAEAGPNAPVHPNNNLIASSDGASVKMFDVERSPGAKTGANGKLVLGDEVTLSVEIGDDGVFFGLSMIVLFHDCGPPPLTVTVTSPADGATVSGSVDVEAEVTGGVGAVSVAFFAGGVSLGVMSDPYIVEDWDTTEHPNGPLVVNATAVDEAGNSAFHAVTVEVDNDVVPLPVKVQVTSPSDGATVLASVDVEAVVEGGTGEVTVEFFAGGVSLGSATSEPYTADWDTTEHPNGPVVVSATATDESGDSASHEITVTVDNTGPAVTLTSPKDGTRVSGSVEVEAEVAGGVGAVSVEFFAAGVSLGVDPSAPYTATWDSMTVVDGTGYVISATAADELGQTDTDSVSVSVCNSPPCPDERPRVELTAPTDGTTVSDTVTVSADAFDDVGVDRVEFFVGGTRIGTDFSEPYFVRWDTTREPDGLTKVSAVAFDTIEQVDSDVVTVTVLNVPNEPPEVDLTAPGDETTVKGRAVRVSADALDDVAVDRVEFFVDGRLIETVRTEPYTVLWDSTTLADGSVEISATAFDGPGLSDTDEVKVTVCNALACPDDPPEVDVKAPADGDTVSGSSVLVSADARDDVAVDRVEFYVDGVRIDVDRTAPYRTTWDSTTVADGSGYVISATAFDGAENSGSDKVTVSVDNPPPPLVEIEVELNVGVDRPLFGDLISYQVRILNRSDRGESVTLTSLTLDYAFSLEKPGSGPILSSSCELEVVIEPGVTYVCGFTLIATGDPGETTTRTATATAEGESGGTGTDEDDEQTTVAKLGPILFALTDDEADHEALSCGVEFRYVVKIFNLGTESAEVTLTVAETPGLSFERPTGSRDVPPTGATPTDWPVTAVVRSGVDATVVTSVSVAVKLKADARLVEAEGSEPAFLAGSASEPTILKGSDDPECPPVDADGDSAFGDGVALGLSAAVLATRRGVVRRKQGWWLATHGEDRP